MLRLENKERIMKTAIEKHQLAYKKQTHQNYLSKIPKSEECIE
jgi:hypothetical protein